jgi:hypothetical protein
MPHLAIAAIELAVAFAAFRPEDAFHCLAS